MRCWCFCHTINSSNPSSLMPRSIKNAIIRRDISGDLYFFCNCFVKWRESLTLSNDNLSEPIPPQPLQIYLSKLFVGFGEGIFAFGDLEHYFKMVVFQYSLFSVKLLHSFDEVEGNFCGLCIGLCILLKQFVCFIEQFGVMER